MDVNLQDRSFWDSLTGRRADFSMENRAFNFVCIISFVILLYCIGFDVFIHQWLMIGVMLILILVLTVIYYYSRFLKKYKTGVFVYGICCYLALILNYKYNSGIKGPTLYLFFIIFHLLIATSPSKLYKVWITLHLVFGLGLIAYEYNFPSGIPDTYSTKGGYFMDIVSSYIIGIIFFFFITRYIRGYYYSEKKLAQQRAIDIEKQNELILIQNQQLEQLNAEKNKLFSIVSHDLRSPIDTILGYLEIISEDLLEPEEKKGFELELRNKVKYTSELLLNLLFWSKAQMKGVNVHLSPVIVMELLDDARNYLIAHAAKKSIKITYGISKEIEVVADKEMLRIVLRNLMANAVKFTKDGGEVVIKLKNVEGNAIISVIDNGIGIPIDKQTEIFTLKANSTSGTQNEKGIGLGLLLCKEFIDYQQGKIWFESLEGIGSTFFISLPMPKQL